MYARIYMIRHGEVASEWAGKVYGCMDVPLSSHGEDQAREAAGRLSGTPLKFVVSSGLRRSEFGAARLVETRPVESVIADSSLREIERGEWAGQFPAEMSGHAREAWNAWSLRPARARPRGGESLEDLSIRVLPRLDHWAAQAPGEAVAMVVHLWVIRVAVCAATGMDLDLAPRVDIPTGGMAILDWPCSPNQPSAGARCASSAVGEPPPGSRPRLVGFSLDDVPVSDEPGFRGPPASSQAPESKFD